MIWDIDNLETIGDHKPSVAGAPKVIESAGGKALEFDGEKDALFLDIHPLAGMNTFTAEIVFQPYPDGLEEQRFFHMQANDGEDRVLFETRLTGDNQWFLDTFIKSGDGDYTQFAQDFKHPIGPWYQAAITLANNRFRHYVNGNLELEIEIAFKPHGPGRTSLGVRINRVCWFKGAIRQVRFTPEALSPKDFLRP